MNSTRIACTTLAASACVLLGMLIQTLCFAPAPAAAATVSGQGNIQAATAKIQNGEDALIVLSGDTLLAYRTNVGAKTLELIDAKKIGGAAGGAPAAGGSRRGGR